MKKSRELKKKKCHFHNKSSIVSQVKRRLKKMRRVRKNFFLRTYI